MIDFGGWEPEIHAEPDQVKRIESGRKLKKKIVQIDYKRGWADIEGSGPEPYRVTLTDCECFDFGARLAPCKHMYCLAFELDLMEDLPKYDRRHSDFDKAAEIEKYKDLYLAGKISADTYVKLAGVLAKA